MPSAAVRHIPPSQVVAPPRVASLAELVTKLNALSQNVRSMTATVDLEPTTGSIYSGVIKEYHNVRGFILIQSPSMIRVLGQAPVVRTDIFDMVSNGEEYRLYIPPVNKFFVGKTAFRRPAKNSLENLQAPNTFWKPCWSRELILPVKCGCSRKRRGRRPGIDIMWLRS